MNVSDIRLSKSFISGISEILIEKSLQKPAGGDFEAIFEIAYNDRNYSLWPSSNLASRPFLTYAHTPNIFVLKSKEADKKAEFLG